MSYVRTLQHKGLSFNVSNDFGVGFDWNDPYFYSKAEAALHERFADKRDIGEWFRLTPEDVAYIKSLKDGAL